MRGCALCPPNGPGLFLSVRQKVPKLVLEYQRQARRMSKRTLRGLPGTGVMRSVSETHQLSGDLRCVDRSQLRASNSFEPRLWTFCKNAARGSGESNGMYVDMSFPPSKRGPLISPVALRVTRAIGGKHLPAIFHPEVPKGGMPADIPMDSQRSRYLWALSSPPENGTSNRAYPTHRCACCTLMRCYGPDMACEECAARILEETRKQRP
jgi:hypothetical protein